MSQKKDAVVRKFIDLFGDPEYVVRAPGRANIIGEHVDYCGGLVLPFAIEQSMYFCLRSNESQVINYHSIDFDDTYTIKDDILNSDKEWCKYFNELIKVFKQRGVNITGIDIAFGSDIPIGGGVSSSSALCCGLLKVLDLKFNLYLSTQDMIDLAAAAEHGIGLKGGEMDQTSILLGRQDHAILLDCESNSYDYIELSFENQSFMLFDTNVKHSLVDSQYNNRRDQAEEALTLVKRTHGEGCTFRNITEEQIAFLHSTNPLCYQRIKHVVTEIRRVEDAVEAIKIKNPSTLGKLMNKSHASLTDDYEVSCDESDFLADKLQSFEEVLGARMMGGGFGGNVIALIKEEISTEKLNCLKQEYFDTFGIEMRTLKVRASDGVSVLKE